MINTFFCSDHHFFHKNILVYEKEKRPFSCLEEMHEVIIERHNSVVKPTDLVYFLGDFCFSRHNLNIAERLNGRKKLILGNHDTHPTEEYLKYFEKLYGVVFYNRCILSHVPVHANGISERWLLNIHGHLHSKKVMFDTYNVDCIGNIHKDSELEYRRYFNVSLEQNNLTPIHWDEIAARLKEIEGCQIKANSMTERMQENTDEATESS